MRQPSLNALFLYVYICNSPDSQLWILCFTYMKHVIHSCGQCRNIAYQRKKHRL